MLPAVIGSGFLEFARGVTSTAIRTAIQHVMATPGFRDGAQRLAKAMGIENGAKTAADELETLAAPSRPQVTIAPWAGSRA
jgi:UDP:flavonoid glycosyltransferase YjiC (YdhE family)